MHRNLGVAILLSATLLQGCATAVRQTRTGGEERYYCIPPRGNTMLPLLTTFAGLSTGMLVTLAYSLGSAVAAKEPDPPPFGLIGGAAGLAIGLVTVAVTPDCPKRTTGAASPSREH